MLNAEHNLFVTDELSSKSSITAVSNLFIDLFKMFLNNYS